MVIVSDFEKVPEDDFYLIDKNWAKNNPEEQQQCQKLAKEGNLYYGYEVSAQNYVIYKQMDSMMVLIDNDNNIIMFCESCVISNQHKSAWVDDEE